MTTHQLGFVEGLADRAALLSDGQVMAMGTYDEVAAHVAALGWASA
jgi:ABC-type multidrug transport system ATPase subunit